MAYMLVHQVRLSFGRHKSFLVKHPRARNNLCAVAESVTNKQDNQRLQLVLTIGSKAIPHPEKEEKGGEDAFFASNFGGGVLGIADGVSGWAEADVDPALFSKEFVSHLETAVTQEESRDDPKTLLANAHAATTSIGAATAIVATLLASEGILRIANVGDCGLRVVRNGKVVFATAPQQHYFDCPYQFSSELEGQTAEDAALYEVQMMEGDTVVMGSDGLFDNVFDQDIAAAVTAFDDKSVEETAAVLATLASRNSRDPKYESPYINEARSQGYDVPIWRKLLGQKLTGGKLDDITVLVGVVTQSRALSDSSDLENEKPDEEEDVQRTRTD